jgi:hypothetical protein
MPALFSCQVMRLRTRIIGFDNDPAHAVLLLSYLPSLIPKPLSHCQPSTVHSLLSALYRLALLRPVRVDRLAVGGFGGFHDGL